MLGMQKDRFLNKWISKFPDLSTLMSRKYKISKKSDPLQLEVGKFADPSKRGQGWQLPTPDNLIALEFKIQTSYKKRLANLPTPDGLIVLEFKIQTLYKKSSANMPTSDGLIASAFKIQASYEKGSAMK